MLNFSPTETAHPASSQESGSVITGKKMAALATALALSLGKILGQEQLPQPTPIPPAPPPLKKKDDPGVTFLPKHCIDELVQRSGDPHFPTRDAATRDLQHYFSTHADREGMMHFLKIGLSSDDLEIRRRTELVSERTADRIRDTILETPDCKKDIAYLSSLLPEGLPRVPWVDSFQKYEPAAQKLFEMTGIPAHPLMHHSMANGAHLPRQDVPGDPYPTYTHGMRVVLESIAKKEVHGYFFRSDRAEAKSEAERRIRELLELQLFGEENWRQSLRLPPARPKKEQNPGPQLQANPPPPGSMSMRSILKHQERKMLLRPLLPMM